MSYQAQECGPWGITLSSELGQMARRNTAYSEFAWQSAKQEGCHYPCPNKRLPSFPPSGKFLYPTLQKQKQVVLGAHQYNPNLQECPEAAPWQDEAPERSSLTCAMSRAQQFLNEQPGGYDPTTQFNYSNVEEDSDIAAQVARSILGGSIPMNNCSGSPPNSSEENSSEGNFGASRKNENQGIMSPKVLNGTVPNSVLEEVHSFAGSENEYNIRNLFPCIGNSFAGIAYDMAHYDELPTDNKFEFVLMRDDRWKYVVTTVLLFLFIILLICAIVTTCVSTKVHGKIIDLGQLGIDNLDDMQIIIRPKKYE